MPNLDSYFPFDSGSGSNVTENQWSEFMRHVMGDGVIRNELNSFAVFGDSTGMQVKVPSGKAWIKGHYGSNTSQVTVPIAAADPTNPRIDRVVLRLDWTANTISLEVLQGTPAGSPSAPSLTRTATRWELSLARVAVAAAASTISAGNVTDERQDPTVCGFTGTDSNGLLSAPAGFWMPVFAAYRSSNVSNFSGNGAVYTVPFDTATVAHSGYATGTGIFTVPVGQAGNYKFGASVGVVASGSSQTQVVLSLVTTPRTFRFDGDPYGSRNKASGVTSIVTPPITVPLAAGDTARVQVTISGGGSNDATLVGSSTAYTFFNAERAA